jgi:hypothetical protein
MHEDPVPSGRAERHEAQLRLGRIEEHPQEQDDGLAVLMDADLAQSPQSARSTASAMSCRCPRATPLMTYHCSGVPELYA